MNSFLGNRIWTLFLSIALSLVLWLYVHGRFQLRQVLDVRVNYVSGERHVVVGPRTQSLQVEVRGPAALVRSLYGKEHHLDIDVADFEPGVIVYRDFDVALHRIFPREIELLYVNPREIKFEVDQFAKKSADLAVEMRGEPREGFEVVSTEIAPPQVWAAGAKRVLEPLEQITIGPIDLAGRAETFSVEVPLQVHGSDYWIMGTPNAAVTVRIAEKTIQRTVRVPVKVITGSQPMQTDIAPPEIQVVVEGPFQAVRALAPGDFLAYVDAKDLRVGTYKRPAAIKSPPAIKLLDNTPRYFSVRVWR